MMVEIGPNKVRGQIDIDRNVITVLPGNSRGLQISLNEVSWSPADMSWVDDFIKDSLETVITTTNDDVVRKHVGRLLNQAFGEVKLWKKVSSNKKNLDREAWEKAVNILTEVVHSPTLARSILEEMNKQGVVISARKETTRATNR